jgi:hypothetical protein
MPKPPEMIRFAAPILALLALCAAPARAETDVGALAALLAGTHVGADNPSVSGVGGGALLELTQKWDRFRIHLEGIPHVSVSGTAPTNGFGKSVASLSILNATAMVDLDAHQRVRAGAGFQLVNLSNFNGNNGDTNYARVASPRFEIDSELPMAGRHFFALGFAVMPNVQGVLHAITIQNVPEIDRPEHGSEVDYSFGYGWHAGSSTYILGVRGINYKTRNINTGELVDSNVGAGLTFEARFPIIR